MQLRHEAEPAERAAGMRRDGEDMTGVTYEQINYRNECVNTYSLKGIWIHQEGWEDKDLMNSSCLRSEFVTRLQSACSINAFSPNYLLWNNILSFMQYKTTIWDVYQSLKSTLMQHEMTHCAALAYIYLFMNDRFHWPASAGMFHPHRGLATPWFHHPAFLCNKTPAADCAVKWPARITSSKRPLACVIEQLPSCLICHQWGLPLSWFTGMPTCCLTHPVDSIKSFSGEVSGDGENNSHFHGKMVSITACASHG